MRRRPQIPSLLLAVVVVAAAVAITQARQELAKVPRVRVGPLETVEPAGEHLRIFALGDTGSAQDAQMRVATAMEQRCREKGVDVLLLLGDNAYPAGVSSVEDPGWQTKVIGPYSGSCLGSVPIYAVLGNHDYKGNPSAEIAYTLVNRRWHMPNRFYSTRFGDLLKVVALDSNFNEFCFQPAFCGVDFLLEQIHRHETAWTFVIAHHPLLSSSDHGFAYRGGIRGMLLKPFLCDTVDLYLSGHSHHLEYLEPEGCRLKLAVAGGGGGDLYQAGARRAESLFLKSAYGFLDVELNRQELTVRVVGDHGELLFEKTNHLIGKS